MEEGNCGRISGIWVHLGGPRGIVGGVGQGQRRRIPQMHKEGELKRQGLKEGTRDGEEDVHVRHQRARPD